MITSKQALAALRRGLIVYILCPVCGEQIREPFSRYGGPIVFVHRTKREVLRVRCRLLIEPDR